MPEPVILMVSWNADTIFVAIVMLLILGPFGVYSPIEQAYHWLRYGDIIDRDFFWVFSLA